jgi:hypothetical protein
LSLLSLIAIACSPFVSGAGLSRPFAFVVSSPSLRDSAAQEIAILRSPNPRCFDDSLRAADDSCMVYAVRMSMMRRREDNAVPFGELATFDVVRLALVCRGRLVCKSFWPSQEPRECARSGAFLFHSQAKTVLCEFLKMEDGRGERYRQRC